MAKVHQAHGSKMLHLWTSGALPKGVPTHGMYVGQGFERTASNFFTCLVIPVWLNGRQVDVLVDTGCGQTRVQQAEGTPLEEVLQIKYIHGHGREYHTVLAWLQVAGQQFGWLVGAVSHMDCPVLFGRNCSIVAQIL